MLIRTLNKFPDTNEWLMQGPQNLCYMLPELRGIKDVVCYISIRCGFKLSLRSDPVKQIAEHYIGSSEGLS